MRAAWKRQVKDFQECFDAKGKIQKTTDGAGAALAAKDGERNKSSLKGASRSMYKSMSEEDLKKMASTKRKNLPKRKK